MRGYKTYKGKKSQKRPVITGLLGFFALFLIFFILFSFNVIVFDEQGLHFYKAKPNKETQNLQPESTNKKTQEGEQSDKQVKNENTNIKAGFLPISYVKAKDVKKAKELLLKGENTIILEVKSKEGELSYDTKERLKSIADAFKMENITLIAYISTLRDGTYPYKNRKEAILTKKGSLWLDKARELPYISPSSEKGRAYLKQIVEDCVFADFDGVMLSNLTYPIYGNLSYLSYKDEDSAKREAQILNCLEYITKPLKKAKKIIIAECDYVNLEQKASSISGNNANKMLELCDYLAVSYFKEDTTWYKSYSSTTTESYFKRCESIKKEKLIYFTNESLKEQAKGQYIYLQ